MSQLANVIAEIKNTINPRSIMSLLNIESILLDNILDNIIYKSNNARFEILVSDTNRTLFVWHFMNIDEKLVIECNNGKYLIYIEDNKYKKYINYRVKMGFENN